MGREESNKSSKLSSCYDLDIGKVLEFLIHGKDPGFGRAETWTYAAYVSERPAGRRLDLLF